jgi:hypothetical protein
LRVGVVSELVEVEAIFLTTFNNDLCSPPALVRRRVTLLQRAPRLSDPAAAPHVPLGDDLCRLGSRRRSFPSSSSVDPFGVVDRRIQPFVSEFDSVAPRFRPRHGNFGRKTR